MKDLKNILENYEEAPSEGMWSRLNERLDAEMPVGKSVAGRQWGAVWKWAAVALSVLAVGGGIAFGVLRHPKDKQPVVAQQTTKTPVVEENTATLTADEPSTEVTSQEVVEKQCMSAEVEKVPAKNVERESEPTQQPKEQVIPKTNARQEVLPANSTLARQLAADPVLKDLSDQNVAWTKPAHLSIPNLFTPNDDGVNDYFVIEGMELYSSPRLVVRDKNNRIVYQSNKYDNNWGGENCPDGLYSYEFTFIYSGIENQATGKVRIIRT